MARPILSLVCMVLVACATGCAGPKLTSHNARRLQLGQTNEPQVRAIFGKPDLTDERSDGSGVSRVVEYRFVSGGIDLIGYRDLELRFLVADVYNGRLRGWMFVSSDDDNPTRIRTSAVPQIESGRATAAMVPLTLRAAMLMEFGPTFSYEWVRDFIRRTWVELLLASGP